MKKCVILAGGPIQDYNAIVNHIGNRDMVLCADGGMRHLKKFGLRPHILLGDFDSCDQGDFAQWKKEAKVVKFPPKKDCTDTELAIEYAIEEGCQDLLILGATGGRMDHALANIQLLIKAHHQGVKCTLLDECNKISLITDNEEIKKGFGSYVSLIPLSSQVKGITTEGLLYPLKDATMSIGTSLGVSNEMTSDKASVAITEGYLILIQSRDA